MSDYLKYVGGTAGAVTLGAVTAAAAYYVATRPSVPQLTHDLNNQALEVPGVPHARCSVLLKDGQLIQYPIKDATNFYDAFVLGARLSGSGPCLGWKPSKNEPYQWISYNGVLLRAANFGAGLLTKGLKVGNSTRVGIYSQNRVEYIVTELGCYTYSMVLVPLYDTLGAEACVYIINQAEISTVVCDKNEKVASLLADKEKMAGLSTIICMDPPTPQNQAAAQKCGVELVSFSDIESLGESNPQTFEPCTAENICVICYTSGTTGDPKGAVITHGQLLSASGAILKQLEYINFSTEDVHISYLPLAHMYERMVQTCIYAVGGRVGFFQGDIHLLTDDIKELQPTIFSTVPRLLNRMYDKVLATVSSSPIKKRLFQMALNSKMKEVERGIIRRNSIWDKLVFSKVQESMGGRVRLLACGSAPLSAKVLNFVRAAIGCNVVEGYGCTETCGAGTLHMQGDGTAGHVGPPLCCNMIKVVDVPEMGYFAENEKGEICIKGYNIFSGYLHLPDKTAEALDEEGWLHTGDIGEWLPNGTLKIIDRKKHIFKLAQGEYVAPEKIENVYMRSRPVAQMFVHGDSLQHCLVGVAVPDPETIQKWSKEKLDIQGSIPDLCNNPAVKKAVLDDISHIGKKSGLKSFEQVKDVHLHPELFSVENGLLTPTFKSKRNELVKYFRPHIDAMYTKLLAQTPNASL